MAVVAKRAIMHLYSDPQCPYSHRVRIVLAEKGVGFEVLDTTQQTHKADLVDLNPYQKAPVLVDRDLVLYESGVIMEYLDERFPHPPLLPVYPVARAEYRQLIYRINHDWYKLMHDILERTAKQAEKARKALLDNLTALGPVFADKPYFMSEEFSLIDCCLAPLLWRLPVLGIELPKQAKQVRAYMDRVFERDSFQASLTEVERELTAA